MMGVVVAKVAKKYGMKVKVVPEVKDTPSQTDEKALFRKNVGSMPLTGDKAHKMAKDEAKMRAIQKQLAKAKTNVDTQIDTQKKQIDQQCASAKKQIGSLNGKNNAAKRLAHLKKAIKFCKTAHGIMHQERQQDYAELTKAEDQMIKENGLEATAAAIKHKTKQVKEAKLDTGAGKLQAKKTHSLKTAETKISTFTTDMVGKATVMCQSMQAKVKKMSADGDFKDHPKAKAALLKQATKFCMKTRGVVKKEMNMDRAMLQKARRVDAMTKPIHTTQDTIKPVDQVALNKATVKADKAAEAKARKEDSAKDTKAMEEKNLTNEQHSAAVAVAVAKKIVPKKITAAQRLHDRKWMADDSHCQAILKNMKQLSQHLLAINMVLEQFDAMQAEATLLAMGAH